MPPSARALDAVAAANDVKVETAKDVKRVGATGVISERVADAVFHTPKDAFAAAEGDDPDQWIVFRVTDITTPTFDSKSTDGEQIAKKVQRDLSDDLIGQYMSKFEDDLSTSVNTAIMAQATGNSAPDTN